MVRQLALSSILLFFTSACGQLLVKVNSPLTSVTGVVQLGLLRNASVRVYCLNSQGNQQSQSLGSGTTDADGRFTVYLADHASCSLLFVASGGSYKEESSGSTVNLSASDEVRSILEMKHCTSQSAEVSVTPISEMAVARYESIRDGLASAGASVSSLEDLDKVIERAKEEIRGVVGLPEGIDITRVLPAPPSKPDSDSNSSKNQLTAVIAGLSEMAAAQGKNSFEMATHLASDAADGAIADADWLNLPSHVSNWTSGNQNPGGFVPPPQLNPAVAPSVELDKYPLPIDNILKNSAARLNVSPLNALIGANCVGPFDVRLMNVPFDPLVLEASLPVSITAADPLPLKIFEDQASCVANINAISKSKPLTRFFIRYGVIRPTVIDISVSSGHPDIAGSVVHFALNHVLPSSGSNPEVHMISVQSAASAGSASVTVLSGGGRPVNLVLASYERASWNIFDIGHRVQKVIVYGYYKPTVIGVDPSKVEIRSNEDLSGSFYTLAGGSGIWPYNPNSTEYDLAALRMREEVGGEIVSLQGALSKNSFIVGDGMNLVGNLPSLPTH